MSILATLAKAYDRLPDVPPFGFATQNIHFCIVLDASGVPIGPPVSWETGKKGEPRPRAMNVPYFGGRSGSNAPSYFLWDNSAYVLGVSKKEGFDAEKRFRTFQDHHLTFLENSNSYALRSVRLFIEKWSPERFFLLGFPESMFDKNIVFRFIEDKILIHERADAIDIWKKNYVPDTIGTGVCLITG